MDKITVRDRGTHEVLMEINGDEVYINEELRSKNASDNEAVNLIESLRSKAPEERKGENIGEQSGKDGDSEAES